MSLGARFNAARKSAVFVQKYATIAMALAGSASSHAAMVRSDILNAPTVIVTTSPFRIDRTFTDPLSGSYHVIIDDSTMEMKAQVVAAACAPPCAIDSAFLAESIDDILHFSGLVAGGQAIQFHLIIDETGFIPSSIPGFGPTDITEQLIANLNLTGTPVVGADESSINTNYQNFGPTVPPLRSKNQPHVVRHPVGPNRDTHGVQQRRPAL
jgi:hypothetical protein